MSRALIIGPGGLRGAYEAGVAATLCRELDADYFDAVYGASSGAFTAACFVAGQPQNIEKIWRYLISGNQLFSFLNLLKRKPILNLEYLIGLYKGKEVHLDIGRIFSSKTELKFVVTNVQSGLAEYLIPNPENIFDLLIASGSFPPFHALKKIDSKTYADGGITDPLPIREVLKSYDEVLVIMNGYPSAVNAIGRLFFKLLFPRLGTLLRRKDKELPMIYKEIYTNSRVNFIRPESPLPMSHSFGTNSQEINLIFEAGVQDAWRYAKRLQVGR